MHLLLNAGRQIGFEYSDAIVLELNLNCFGINNCRILPLCGNNAHGRYYEKNCSSEIHANIFTQSPKIEQRQLCRGGHYAETGFGSADLRELMAARTKLLPSSHIGPGNLRQSVKTLSSAVTNKAISFSPIMSGGRILSTSMA